MKESILYACSYIIDDDFMWFVAGRYNYLCCYNIKSACIEKKYKLPEDNFYMRMYDNILLYKENLYLIPFNGADVLVFNKIQEQFEHISIAPYNSVDEQFYAATIYRDNLYLFPECISVKYDNPYIIVKVDLVRKEVKCIKLNLSILHTKKDYHEVFDRNYHVIEDRLYVLMQLTNKVLEYHLKNDTWRIIEIGRKNSQYATLQVDGNIFYLINQNGDVTVWNYENNEFSEYQNGIDGYEVESKELYAAFSCSFVHKDKVYFIPRFANKVIMFDDKNIEEVSFFKNILLTDKIMEQAIHMKHFLCSVVKNDKLYLWDYVTYRFIIIDLKTKNWTSRKIITTFTDDELNLLYRKNKKLQMNGGMEYQTSYYNLNYYLHNIVYEKEINDEIYIEENVGKTILKKIM